MGTWAIPYDSTERAKRFRKRMARPWIATVKKESDGYYYATFPDSELIGDDVLSDALADKATRAKKNFDIRLYVRKELKRWMQELILEEDVPSVEAVNITRAVVNLGPLNLQKNRATAAKRGITFKQVRKKVIVRKKVVAKKKARPIKKRT